MAGAVRGTGPGAVGASDRAEARRRERLTALRPVFDRLYAEYDHAAVLADPVEQVRPYASPADREIAGFFAAGLAFGRVASITQSIARFSLFRPSASPT